MYELSVAAVIASNNIQYLKKSLCAIVEQNEPFNKIVLVPWGRDSDFISKYFSAVENLICLRSEEDSSLETNRNRAIEYLLKEAFVPDYISFIDDDAILDSSWLDSMKHSAGDGGKPFVAFSSTTFPIEFNEYHKSTNQPVQSCGHNFVDTSPRDVLFKSNKDAIPKTDFRIGSPCGNSSFIPTWALREIVAYDNIWDKDFSQWQTCFSLGIKLALVGCKSMCSVESIAYHEGKPLRCKNQIAEADIFGQLRSRMLLYRKYYPKKYLDEATENLENRITRWSEGKYPTSDIAGEKLTQLFTQAKEAAYSFTINPYWKEKISALSESDIRNLLFDT